MNQVEFELMVRRLGLKAATWLLHCAVVRVARLLSVAARAVAEGR